MKSFKQISITVSLFIIFLSISLLLHVYPSTNYKIQYSLNDIQTTINESQFEKATTNLRHFFLHTASLNQSIYTPDEIQHYIEVRKIYDFILLLMIISCSVLIGLRTTQQEIIKAAKIIFILVPLTILFIPLFSIIFNGIFHQILFSNSLWIMHPHQISYYLFPEKFFLNSFVSIILLIEIFAGISYFILKRIAPLPDINKRKKK